MDALFGDIEGVVDKARRMSEAQHRELRPVRDLIDDAAGQRFLWWLLEQTHVFQSSFTGNSTTFGGRAQRGPEALCPVHGGGTRFYAEVDRF